MKNTSCFFLPFLLLPLLLNSQSALEMPDGIISESDLTDFKMLGNNGDNKIFIQNSGDYLKLSIQSAELYVASLCLCSQDQIIVLHASAALGKLIYKKDEHGVWRTEDEAFTYGMRDTAMDQAAVSKRQAYLTEQSWVANTMAMGNTGETEIIIHKKLLPVSSTNARLALGLMTAADPEKIVDFPEKRTPGCAALSLVGGYIENSYDFRPDEWFYIEF